MTNPEQPSGDRPTELPPGTSQFLFAERLEQAGQLNRAALMFEQAIRKNYAGEVDPDSFDRGLINTARERAVQAWENVANIQDSEGNSGMAVSARRRAELCARIPGQDEEWGLGFSDADFDELETCLRAEIKL